MLSTRRRFVLGFAAGLLACLSRGPAAAGPAPASVLGKPAQATDGEGLRDEVLRALLARYAAARHIGVAPVEVDAYLARMQRTLQRDYARARTRRDALTQRLASEELEAAERQALAREVGDAAAMAQALESVNYAADDPADLATRREVAAAFILHWKIHRALYRQYGGRIVYQQGGPEPLDAVRRFLEHHQARGDFAIVDPALRASFWRYYRDDTLHSFYPRGSREEAQAFNVPPWLATPAD